MRAADLSLEPGREAPCWGRMARGKTNFVEAAGLCRDAGQPPGRRRCAAGAKAVAERAILRAAITSSERDKPGGGSRVNPGAGEPGPRLKSRACAAPPAQVLGVLAQQCCSRPRILAPGQGRPPSRRRRVPRRTSGGQRAPATRGVRADYERGGTASGQALLKSARTRSGLRREFPPGPVGHAGHRQTATSEQEEGGGEGMGAGPPRLDAWERASSPEGVAELLAGRNRADPPRCARLVAKGPTPRVSPVGPTKVSINYRQSGPEGGG